MVLQFFVVILVATVGVISTLRIQSEINVALRGEEAATGYGVYLITIATTAVVFALLWFGVSNVNWLSAAFYVVARICTTVGVPAVMFLEVRRTSRNPANNPDPVQLYHKYMWIAWTVSLPILLILWWSSIWCTWRGEVAIFWRLLLWFCTSLTIAMVVEDRFRRFSGIRLALLAIVLLVASGFVLFTIRGGWVTQLLFMAVGPVMVPICFGYGWSRLVQMYLTDESVYADDPVVDTTGEIPPAAPVAGRHSTTRRRRPASSGTEGHGASTAVHVPIN